MKDYGISVYKCPKIFGIPESTLRDRHLGLQPGESVPRLGKMPMFSTAEEQGLVDHVKYMATIGYGYSKQEFLNLSNDFAISLGKKSENDSTFKHPWYSRILKRWPELRLEKAEGALHGFQCPVKVFTTATQ